MRAIAGDLHCGAVRISGGLPERLTAAAEEAAAAGLEVWFAPFPCELAPARMADLFADCARRAEDVRRGGADVVLVTGCEISLFADGFVPGADVHARIEALMTGDPAVHAAMRDLPQRVNAFLADAAATARDHFAGEITYAAGPWEDIDWGPFDIVSVDAYRDAGNAAAYRDGLRRHFTHGKPVAVTEFGCCTYAGAAGRGGTGWMIADRDADPPRLDGAYRRDEQEQVRYLRELLDVFESEGVDSAFWFTFAGFGMPHDPADPVHDLDMASYGVVGMRPDGTWRPKAAFHAMAAAYGAAGR